MSGAWCRALAAVTAMARHTRVSFPACHGGALMLATLPQHRRAVPGSGCPHAWVQRPVRPLHTARSAPTPTSTSAPAATEAEASVRSSLARVAARIGLVAARRRAEELSEVMSRQDLWDDPQAAGKVVKEHAALAARLDKHDSLETALDNAVELAAMAADEGDDALAQECAAELARLQGDARELELSALLSDAGSERDCYLEILAGAGGTEACDWCEMLGRMYERWAATKGFGVRVVDKSVAEEAGLRSLCLRLEGAAAYGWARTEAGVHRLVRVSPFDSAGRRHTSFARVQVFPVEDGGDGPSGAAAIPLSDLRIDTFRSSGPGGQHVNTTDSAVRITHIPTGIVASCQGGRSQHANRASAMEVLAARLAAQAEAAQRGERDEYVSSLGDNAWGSQIRSYVLQPYRMVKDHRTGVEVADVMSVLDGDLDVLIEAALAAEGASE